MKLGFFIAGMNSGGAERVMSILVNNFVLNNHEVHLFIFSKDVSFYKIHPAVKIHSIYSQRNYFGKLGTFVLHSKSIVKANRLIQHNKLECLIGFVTFINCITVILGKLTGTPVIISERIDPHFKTNFFDNLLRTQLYRHADSIVLQTHRSMNSFRELGIRLPLSTKVIFNPIDASFSNEKMPREKIILAVGRLNIQKGYDLLLKAFARANFKEWRLHIIGEGIEKGKLVQLSKNLNIDKYIVWHGKQTHISGFLNRSSIYVMSSRMEGFPNALCEAMACGCAAISFDCPNGPSEVIKNGENGLLVDAEDIKGLTDAINTLIEDVNLRDKLGAEASKIKDRLDQHSIFLEWEAYISDRIKASQKTK